MTEQLVEMWKKARESVEHFDRLLAEFRKMIFTIDGIAITAVITLLLSNNANRVLYAGWVGIILSFVNIIVWVVEKHYHLYLLASARVARELERKMALDESVQLTSQLKKVKICFPIFKEQMSFYDSLYMIPALGALAFAFCANLRSLAILFFLIEFFIVKVISRHHSASEKDGEL